MDADLGQPPCSNSRRTGRFSSSAGKPCLAYPVADFCNKICRKRISKLAVRSIILRSSAPELSNNIIQKGLAFIDDWSGTVVKSGRHERPGILPRRLVGRGGASVMRRNAAINRMEDSDAKVFKEAIA
jgi:hypothetical protein